MRRVFGTIFTFLFSLTSFSNEMDSIMKRSWFQNKLATSLEIKKFISISDNNIVQSITINDVRIIQSIMDRIEKIPEDGDMMKSFGPDAEQIDLLFCYEKQVQVIQIFQKRFKTPSTGFNSKKNEIEISLYNDIDALLFPDFIKIIPKIENLELKFSKFSITYKGSESYDYFPATVSGTIDKFLVRDRNKNEQLIEINSGQTPPQPAAVDFGYLKVIVVTCQTESKDPKKLYPDYFQVMEIK